MKNKIMLSILISALIFTLIFIFLLQDKKCDKPIITFTFDDGYKDQHTQAFPIFQKNKLKATTYVITCLVGSQFENETLMNWDDINELRDNGWEIGSHTCNHNYLTKLDKEEINYELEKSRIMLEEQGFNSKSLSVPYGDYNSEVRDIAQQYYQSVRTSEWVTNNLSSIDKYNLKAFWLINNTSLNDVESWVDEAGKNNSWIIIMLHHVRTNLSREYSTHPNNIDEILRYVKEKNIEVKTISEVLEQCG